MKYILQNGGDPTGANMFNGYVDQLIASQQYAPQQQEIAPEEQESDYIRSLRTYEEDEPAFDQEKYLKTRFDEIINLLQDHFNNAQAQTDELDWLSSDDGNEYLANLYDTKRSSAIQEVQSQPQSNYILPGQEDSIDWWGGNAGGSNVPTESRNNYGNIKGQDGKFLNFSTPQQGRSALIKQLNLYKTGQTKNPVKPTSTLYEAMQVYAPKKDNNNPVQYAQFIAKRLGIQPTAQIKDIDVEKWADAISIMEGNKNIGY